MSDTVLDKIARKAAEDVEAIRAAGTQRAADLTATILGEAEKKAEQIKQDGAARVDLLLRGGRLQAASASKLRLLNKRQALLTDARLAAKQALASLPDERKDTLYASLCASCGMRGTVIVSVSEGDMSHYRDGSLLASWSALASEQSGRDVTFILGETPADIDGGILLEGDVYDVDLSYDTLLDGVMEQHGKAVLDCLFGTGERHDG